MLHLLEMIPKLLKQGQILVCATIISHQGSSPRSSGSTMLMGTNGLLWGSVGGGLLEAEVLKAGQDMIHAQRPDAQTLHFDLSGELQAGADMICGGELSLLLELLQPQPNLVAFYIALQRAWKSGVSFLTLFGPNSSRTLLLPPQDYSGRLLSDALVPSFDPAPQAVLNLAIQAMHRPDSHALRGKESPTRIDHGNDSWFVKPWMAPPLLILAGGGHVAQATASIATQLDFEVAVIDDRPEFVSAERFPTASTLLHCPAFQHCFEHVHVNEGCYIAILSRGHMFDTAILAQALRTQASYIGMIGSRTKRNAVYESLSQQGFTERDFEQVHCPIGLDIAAETPAEIAVSIMAECIFHYRTIRI